MQVFSVLLLLLAPLLSEAIGTVEKVHVLIDEIKENREWVAHVVPIWNFMSRKEAEIAMEGEVPPRDLPQSVREIVAEIMRTDPTVIHVSVKYDSSWSERTIAKLEQQASDESARTRIDLGRLLKPFLPFWESFASPWLCQYEELAKQVSPSFQCDKKNVESSQKT